jgi:hypothetical protein
MSLRTVTGPTGLWVGQDAALEGRYGFRQNNACSFDICVYKQSVWLAMWG